MYNKTIINWEEHRVALPWVCKISVETNNDNYDIWTIRSWEFVDWAILDMTHSDWFYRNSIIINNVTYNFYWDDCSSATKVTWILMWNKVYIWSIRWLQL